jgi:urease accessory protein
MSRRGIVAVLLALLPIVAIAHEEAGQAAGFVAGLVHPVSGADHVVAMVAVGLWGAVLGPPAIWVLPVAFPLVMALGGLMALLGMQVPAVEFGIALSAVVLGVMVLAEQRPPLAVAAAIVAFFAIFHGHAHGRELPAGTSALLYSLGFVIATGCLHALGIGIGSVHSRPCGRQLLRVAGGAVAAGGVFFMVRALA